MNRKSFLRLLGKGAAVLAVAPSILASILKPEETFEFSSIRVGGRTFHFKKSPYDGSNVNPLVMDEMGKMEFRNMDTVVGKLVKEHGSVEYLHFAGTHETKMLKKYWADHEKAMLTDPKAFHDYLDKI